MNTNNLIDFIDFKNRCKKISNVLDLQARIDRIRTDVANVNKLIVELRTLNKKPTHITEEEK